MVAVAEIGVVIELKKSNDRAAKYSLLKYIEQVFTNQPNRIIVHGMTFAGKSLRFYVFDRGSVYQWCAYDCVDRPESMDVQI